MPGQHAPEKSGIQTLRKKVATGRMTAMKGRVGRELTAEEMRDCQQQLVELESKREEGILSRRHASAEANRVIHAVESVAASHGAELRQSGAAVVQHVDGRFDALVIHGVRCKLVILGSPSTLQLDGLGHAQLKPLAAASKVFVLTKGADKFVPGRVVIEGKRAPKLVDEDDRTLSRVAAVRFQLNGKPVLPRLQVAESEKKKQLARGAPLQLHGIACRVLGPGLVQ
ncbi:unnamed protein product, partial [Symbiodinium sp. CCMP2456]